MTIAHDAPTPNPEATPTLEGVWRVVAEQRREIRRLTQRLLFLEQEDLVTTINEHDDRLDKHDGRLGQLEQVVKNTELWMSGIKHAVDEGNAMLRQVIAKAAP